jgi:hypothetical protein
MRLRMLWLSIRCLFGFHINGNRIRSAGDGYEPVCDFCGTDLVQSAEAGEKGSATCQK